MVFLGESRKKILKTFLHILYAIVRIYFFRLSAQSSIAKCPISKVKYMSVLESILFAVEEKSHQPLFLRTSITFCFRVENVEMSDTIYV